MVNTYLNKYINVKCITKKKKIIYYFSRCSCSSRKQKKNFEKPKRELI